MGSAPLYVINANTYNRALPLFVIGPFNKHQSGRSNLYKTINALNMGGPQLMEYL